METGRLQVFSRERRRYPCLARLTALVSIFSFDSFLTVLAMKFQNSVIALIVFMIGYLPCTEMLGADEAARRAPVGNAQKPDQVGHAREGRIVVPTNQVLKPAGHD